MNYAILNGIDVQQSAIGIQRSKLTTKLSKHARNPNLEFSTNMGVNFGRTIDPTTNDFVSEEFISNGYTISSGILIYDGNRLKNSIRRNEILELASLADMDGVKVQLTLDVVLAYFEILFGEDNYNNTAVQLKTINDQIDQMNKLVEAGSRARFEIYDLEAQKASFEQDLTIAQNRIDLGYLSLKGLLNLPSDFDLKILPPPVDQEVFTNIDVVTIDEVFENAIRFQPQARGLEFRIESAMRDIDIAKSGYYPSVFAGVNLISNYSNQFKEPDPSGSGTTFTASNMVQINGEDATISTSQFIPDFVRTPYFNQIDNNFSYGFGVSMSVPIYSNYQTKSNVQQAELDLEFAMAEKNKNTITVKNTMMTLLTDARAAKRSLEASEKTLEARNVAFENAEKRYNLGAINSYEYIGLQDQFTTAQTNYILAKYDYMLKVKVLDFYQGYGVKLK